MKPLRTLFLGTPDFAVPTLELLAEHPDIDLVGVVTMPDRPAGRGKKMTPPPVADFAVRNKINLIQTENVNKCEEFFTAFNQQNVDLIIVLAFAQFLGKKILSLPRVGCFNIHTSLLPKYRGAAPIQYALLNGDDSTGVSIQKMVKKMDAGDICYSQRLDISPRESGGQLYTRLKYAAALGMNDFIKDIVDDKIQYEVQDEKLVSFAPSITKEMGHLDFIEDSFEKMVNKIRAFDPWPGTFCFLNGKRLKVFRLEEIDQRLEQGKVDFSKNMLLVGLRETTVRLCDIQLEGKKRCSDIELLNGLRNSTSEIEIK